MCDEKTVEYLRDLIAEKQVIEEHLSIEGRTDNRNGIPGTSQSENESNKNPSTSASHANNSGGTTKSIAQRLLDQG